MTNQKRTNKKSFDYADLFIGIVLGIVLTIIMISIFGTPNQIADIKGKNLTIDHTGTPEIDTVIIYADDLSFTNGSLNLSWSSPFLPVSEANRIIFVINGSENIFEKKK